jgi:hypothetical protein
MQPKWVQYSALEACHKNLVDLSHRHNFLKDKCIKQLPEEKKRNLVQRHKEKRKREEKLT